MKIFQYSRFEAVVLVLSSLTLALAATLPIPSTRFPTLIAAQNVTLNSANQNLHCEPSYNPFNFFYMSSHTCGEAILKLPKSGPEGIFHDGFPEDPFRLPVSRQAGNCNITVSMANLGVFETSRWSDIRSEASLLNTICSGRLRNLYIGGSVTTGDRNNILIKIERKFPFT